MRGSAVTTHTPFGTTAPFPDQGLRERTSLVDMLGARSVTAQSGFLRAADRLVDGLHVRTDPLVADSPVVLVRIVERHLEPQVPGRQAADCGHQLVAGNDA